MASCCRRLTRPARTRNRAAARAATRSSRIPPDLRWESAASGIVAVASSVSSMSQSRQHNSLHVNDLQFGLVSSPYGSRLSSSSLRSSLPSRIRVLASFNAFQQVIKYSRVCPASGLHTLQTHGASQTDTSRRFGRNRAWEASLRPSDREDYVNFGPLPRSAAIAGGLPSVQARRSRGFGRSATAISRRRGI